MTTFDPGENLENLKKQSKSLLKSVGENDPESIDRIAPYFTDVNAFKLNDAQLVLARERGYESWVKLKTFIELSINPDTDVDAFVAAANNGILSTMQAMLAREPALARVPAALVRAAAMGKTDAIQLLIEHGADIDATTGSGAYVGGPLLSAVECLNDAGPQTVELLLKHGADPNHQPPGGATPLMMAMGTYARSPHKHAAVELLLNAGAKHNQPDVVMAIHRGRADLVESELDANPQLVHQRFSQVNYLWQPFDAPGPTLLHVAADYNEVEIGRLLLSRGADIDASADNDAGQTPIFHTVASWSFVSPDGYNLPFLKMLLEAGADLGISAKIKFETDGASNCEGELREVAPLGFALAFAEGPNWRNSEAAVALLREHGAPES